MRRGRVGAIVRQTVFFFLMIRRPPRPALFPSTTLFRSSRPGLDRVPMGTQADRLQRVHPVDALGRRLHDLPGSSVCLPIQPADRKSTRLNSSHANISYAVFCLKKKNTWLT